MTVPESDNDLMGSALEPKDLAPAVFSQQELLEIAGAFQIEPQGPVQEFDERGNINHHTYLITDATGQEFILQSINSQVFRRPVRVMEAMVEWIGAQTRSLARSRPAEAAVWEPVTLVPTRDGRWWLQVGEGNSRSYWRLMIRIRGIVCHRSLSSVSPGRRLEVAAEMGRGLALTADFAAEMSAAGLKPSLPGYRDTRGYYAQLHSVLLGSRSIHDIEQALPTDPDVRESTKTLFAPVIPDDLARQRREDPELAPFIELALAGEPRAMMLQDGVASGDLRKTPIHGDTKIENFLFCSATGRVKSLVDLDTIMPYTWLADWGDMVRSLVNVAGERETDLDRIQVDSAIFAATAQGFLQACRQATPAELDMMIPAVQAITLELGVRFLTDHLRGDNYFSLAPGDAPDLNKQRAMVQLTLYRRLLEAEAELAEAITAGV